ncbi:MAG: Cof-type HAD-IIB family hydrolase, partial [Clostridia bacterium]|nr:Cof-type HAD-IIB family hydrolase [Clostridia bacterium]
NMLEIVGFPVAMGNGDEKTKQLASFVTKSNEEDGVAYAIERFVLEEGAAS